MPMYDAHMSDTLFTEAASWLMVALAERGYRITPVQLKNWHQIGLIPRPVRRSLGRGRGTVTLYPEGTEARLTRVCAIRAEPGRFDPEQARWRLWWEGWDVDPSLVRRALIAKLDDWERSLAEYVEKLDKADESPDDDPLTELTTVRLPAPLARARKRVGSEDFPTAVNVILSQVMGQFAGWRPDPTDGADPSADQNVMWRLTGFAKVRAGMSEDEGRKLDQDIERSQIRFSQATSLVAMRAALTGAGDADLAAARDELRALGAVARALLPALEPAMGIRFAGRDSLELPEWVAAKLAPGALLYWLALRRYPEYRILTTLGTYVPAILQTIEVEQFQGIEKPPRRRQPRGGHAQGKDRSPCAASLSHPPPRKSRRGMASSSSPATASGSPSNGDI
jgi:hypothetical protein